MFYNCSSLSSLNLSNFITDNVNDMESMFLLCSNLTSLNLSNFNTNNVTDMSRMFYHIPNKCNIIYNDSLIKKNLKNNEFSDGCNIV